MGVLLAAVFVGSVLITGAGLVTGVLAWRKGYRPWFWLLSMGPVGTLLMLLKPNLNRATTPEIREKWEQRADWTGGVLSGFTMFFVVALPLIAITSFFSLRSTAVGLRPPRVAPVPTASMTAEATDENFDAMPSKNDSDNSASDTSFPTQPQAPSAPN